MVAEREKSSDRILSLSMIRISFRGRLIPHDFCIVNPSPPNPRDNKLFPRYVVTRRPSRESIQSMKMVRHWLAVLLTLKWISNCPIAWTINFRSCWNNDEGGLPAILKVHVLETINWSLPLHFNQPITTKSIPRGNHTAETYWWAPDLPITPNFFHNSHARMIHFSNCSMTALSSVHKPECLIGASTFTVNGPQTNFGYFLLFRG